MPARATLATFSFAASALLAGCAATNGLAPEAQLRDASALEKPWLAQQVLDADLQARELSLSINLARALGGGYGTTSPLAAADPQ